MSFEVIPQYLEQSLSPQYAKQAEEQLKSIQSQEGFTINLLHVVSSTNLPLPVRLAGALYFKNLIKSKWTDDEGSYYLSNNDVDKIKSEILDVMIKLPSQLQVQIGESITYIAESDFPHRWPNLIDALVEKLSLEDFVTNEAILYVSHSIFKKWRPLFRSDELFLEIKLVLDRFVQPFMKLFLELDQLITKNADNKALVEIYLKNMLLLVQIYYDFNCQDIPEFFEDNMVVLMNIVHKYLIFFDKEKDGDDDEVTTLIKLKASIIELISLYVTRYADVFEPLIQNFITSVWSLLNDYVTSAPKFDLLVVKALKFLTSIVKVPTYHSLFDSESAINEIIEKIILPNVYMREVDEELFEDEPITYVRLDLEGTDFDSRRKSATDFLKELKEINPELLTSSVLKYVNNFLALKDNAEGWRNKDTAIYLFSAMASKGNITSHGVTSTNVLVDVVQFFSENIVQDLLEASSHLILKVDAIKYILDFRNQLTKDQLSATIPILTSQTEISSNKVVHTYAAITIDKLFEMTTFISGNQYVFTQEDIKPYSKPLLTRFFDLIFLDRAKVSENDFLMKAIMRILSRVEDQLEDRYEIIKMMLQTLKQTAENPTNPRFSHYIFESLGLLIKYAPQDIEKLMETIVPSLLDTLSQDVQEFVPYTFQILAYLLEVYPKSSGLPPIYSTLTKPLLSPSAWEFKGNIPGITRLLITILEHDAGVFTELTPLLGVFQKLISSRVNDNYGFDLLLAILLNVPLANLSAYVRDIAVLILTRLKNSRTDKFLKKFVVFIGILNTIKAENAETYINASSIDGDFVISLIESVQPGVFPQLYQSLILPALEGFINLRDKKIGNIGVSQFLSSQGFNSNYTFLLVPTIEQLTKNLKSYDGIIKSTGAAASNTGGGALNELDMELSAFGSNFSKIISIQSKPFDSLAKISNTDFDSIKSLILANIKNVDVRALQGLSEETRQGLTALGL